MKKAVILTGSNQYLVSEGDTIEVELIKTEDKKLSFDALLVIDGDKTTVGTPIVDKVKVSAEVVNPDVQDDKVTSIRYKAKKRVHKTHGHRQHRTVLKVIEIK
jgi:large subunit ribosomal protein L21